VSNLTDIRNASTLTRADLARATGCRPVHDREMGGRRADPDQARAMLADLFGISISWLIEGQPRA
jgi:hypothetical protein